MEYSAKPGEVRRTAKERRRYFFLVGLMEGVAGPSVIAR